jgi:hypothetical protein
MYDLISALAFLALLIAPCMVGFPKDNGSKH